MDQQFHFEHLVSGAARRASFALRYQVYCQERGFLRPIDYPKGLESDRYDEIALHFGAFHPDGTLGGTVRLVPGALHQLPMSSHCGVDQASLPPGLDTAELAEVSRLAVSRRFRRRATDRDLPDELADIAPGTGRNTMRRQGNPGLVLGLYRTMYQHSKRLGIDVWFAAMEPSLVRLLGRMFFRFRAVGPEVDYYGPVRPYVARLRDLDAEIFAQCPELLRELADGLEPELLPRQLRSPAGTGILRKAGASDGQPHEVPMQYAENTTTTG
ncbi:MAG: PEP-CTERM/exosortase system-associated acyltransferase [Burkholderiaceae bacterium]|nr:PEP-CTERM/exosortase system-associated acyltransferase [Burkholderiaceae bacterium]